MTELPAADERLLALNLQEMRRRNLRPKTLRMRRDSVERFLARVGKPMLEVTKDDAERWYRTIEHLSVASIDAYVRQVQGFYQWLVERGDLGEDPCKELIRPKVPQGIPHPIAEDELELALITAPQPLRAWLVLAAYAGLRSGEIARLRREHILDRHQPPLIHVVDGKGGRERVVPVARVVIDELHAYLNDRGRLWLDHSVSPETLVTQKVSKHLRDLGIPHTCHSLRHRFGTQLYRTSRDIRMTQELMGHASPATTAIYAAWDHEAAAPTVDALGESLQGAAPTILGKRGHRR